MRSAKPDRALRRLVAELAEMAPSDMEAVVEALEPAARGRVQALLGEYLGTPEPERRPAPALDLSGVSPWLAHRLGEVPAGRRAAPAPSFTMTVEATAALRKCAEGVLDGSAPAASSSWMERGRLRRAARRAAS